MTARPLPWTFILVAFWSGVFGLSWINTLTPVSAIFDAGQLRVLDARTGTCPVVEFDRDINRQFFGEWRVTFLRKQGDNFTTAMPIWSGENDYDPGVSLPEGAALNLGWWTWQRGDPEAAPGEVDYSRSGVCRSPIRPGTYKMRTVWTVHMPNGGTRKVTRTSNPFTILP